jgi:hypothetical protein
VPVETPATPVEATPPPVARVVHHRERGTTPTLGGVETPLPGDSLTKRALIRAARKSATTAG